MGSKYYDLFRMAKDLSPSFWLDLKKCYLAEAKRLSPPTTLLFTNTTCLVDAGATNATLASFAKLDYFDVYILSLVLNQKWRPYRWLGEFHLKKYFIKPSDFKMKKWCADTGTCTFEDLRRQLRVWILRLSFMAWLPNLPEENFGTTMAR